MHPGNARTALFSWLLARRHGGDFVLRVEDTDAGRSREALLAGVLEDLRWLGLEWDEGPGREGATGPCRQSERLDIYAGHLGRLVERDRVYECWRTREELRAYRRRRMAAGKPPVYDREWGRLPEEEVRRRRDAGQVPVLRFRVRAGEVVFRDLVRGEQRFAAGDIGDFVVRRSDGSFPFFFCNAVDDALMAISHVLRGEDHLSNTPRQVLLLEALELEPPAWGHLPLVTDAAGEPLSKRRDSLRISRLRESGILPRAVANYCARLGHSLESGELLSLEGLAAAFDLERIGRAPGSFDPTQLEHWQKLAVQAESPAGLARWAGEEALAAVPRERRESFLALVAPNVSRPADVGFWARTLFRHEPVWPPAVADELETVRGGFFEAAVAALDRDGPDLKAVASAVTEGTGARGRELYRPLRLALTGLEHGPELAPVLAVMPAGLARARLARWAAGIE